MECVDESADAEIKNLSEQLQGKRIHQDSSTPQLGPEEKRMKPGDFAEYDELLSQLASELKIARHPDSLVVLRAARLLINDHNPASSLSPEQISLQSQQSTERQQTRIQQAKFTLADVVLPKSLIGPSESDSANESEPRDVLERASKALKLLYLDDQRQLQNQVNELISSVQSITANPKTDPRLLATGR